MIRHGGSPGPPEKKTHTPKVALAGRPAGAAWQVQEPGWLPGLGTGSGFEVWLCHFRSRMGRGFGK